MSLTDSAPQSERTNRQWAWQFLRRNPSYREAFAFFCSLGEARQIALLKLMHGALGRYSEHWSDIGPLPLKLFDSKYLYYKKDDDRTLDEFVKKPKNPFINPDKSKPLGEVIDELILRVKPEFRPGHYGLLEWVDPCIHEMTTEEADEIWFYSVPLEASLVRSPWLDDAGISFERFEWEGQSLDDLLGVPKSERANFQNRKNRPIQAETLPLKKGVNGAIFTINDLDSSQLPNIGRSPVWRDPDALSLDGDTLVRATFDVSLPIEYQLEVVRATLTAHQAELQDAGFVDVLPSRKSRPGVFDSYIVVLDLRDQGLSDLEIATTLSNLKAETYTDAQGNASRVFFDEKKPDRATSQEHTSTIRKQLERARYLRDHGYRSLALQLD